MFAAAPIKRMSILERRPGDTQEFFLRHWHQVHGGMVSRLPHLFAYNQNHVLESFDSVLPGYPAAGFVEQLWRSTREMQMGYNSPVVGELVTDEVNYLGHGSNYAILTGMPLTSAPDGGKLIATVRHGGQVAFADAVADAAASLAGCKLFIRDDVIATIAKPNMLPVPPRAVDVFLHLHFADAASARQAAMQLTDFVNALQAGPLAAFGLHRVETRTIVTPQSGQA